MVFNISDLKKIIKSEILDYLDHKHIDDQVEYFKERCSTAENISIFCFEQLA